MNKKNLQLGLVLVVLIILAYLYQGPLQTWRNNLGVAKNFLSVIDFDTIDKLDITANSQTTVLKKTDQGWKIDSGKELYADDDIIANMKTAIQVAIDGDLELASNNPEKQADFGTDDSGVEVIAYIQDEAVVDFVIGNISSDGMSTYVRQKDSDKTYKAKSNLASAFGHGDWADKKIFAFTGESVDKIRFQFEKVNFTVEKRDDTWVGIIPYRFSVDQEKISNIINTMSGLMADVVPVQSFAGTGLEKNQMIIQMTGQDVDQTIMVGDTNEEGLYFAKRGDSDNIYLINKDIHDKFNVRIQDLK